MTFPEMTAALKKVQDETKSIMQNLIVDGDETKSRPPTDEELRNLEKLREEAEKLTKSIERHREFERVKSVYQYGEEILNLPIDAPMKFELQKADRTKSFVEKFFENDSVKTWRDSLKNGFTPLSPVMIDHSIIKSLISLGGANSAGELIVPMQSGILDVPFAMRAQVRDLVTQGRVDTEKVEFVRVTSFDNNAAEVGEASSVAGTSGTKPTSTFSLERVDETVKGIAHLMHTTKWAVSDAGQLETLINNLATYGLINRLNFQIIRGDGVGDNFTGILNTTGIQTINFATDIAETALRAQTAVAMEFDDPDDPGGGAQPTAYAMHPLDWQEFQLLRDNEGRFYWGGPSVVGPRTLWGLPVVVSNAVPRGQPIVADWRLSTLWDRQQATVQIFEQHADYAARNMVLVRGELRAAFGVIRPAAFATFEMSAS